MNNFVSQSKRIFSHSFFQKKFKNIHHKESVVQSIETFNSQRKHFEDLHLEHLSHLKEEITNLFEESKIYWNKYLDPKGKGLINYLQNISGQNLENIFT